MFIENILHFLNITYKYSESERSYCISHRDNWEIFAQHHLADLHSVKKNRFWEIYNSFKEHHYRKNYLKSALLSKLNEPYTVRQLSQEFQRSKDRISETLSELKRGGLVKDYRVHSINVWIKSSQGVIIVSEVKNKYLRALDEINTTAGIAKRFKVDDKSVYRRLNELVKLGLVKRDINKQWIKTDSDCRLIVWSL